MHENVGSRVRRSFFSLVEQSFVFDSFLLSAFYCRYQNHHHRNYHYRPRTNRSNFPQIRVACGKYNNVSMICVPSPHYLQRFHPIVPLVVHAM